MDWGENSYLVFPEGSVAGSLPSNDSSAPSANTPSKMDGKPQMNALLENQFLVAWLLQSMPQGCGVESPGFITIIVWSLSSFNLHAGFALNEYCGGKLIGPNTMVSYKNKDTLGFRAFSFRAVTKCQQISLRSVMFVCQGPACKMMYLCVGCFVFYLFIETDQFENLKRLPLGSNPVG